MGRCEGLASEAVVLGCDTWYVYRCTTQTLNYAPHGPEPATPTHSSHVLQRLVAYVSSLFRILLLTACPSIGYDTNRGADPFRESVDGGITDLI